MFGKKQGSKKHCEKMDTVIGKGTSCDGFLHTSGSLRLDGDFKGEIKVKGDLIVGETSSVEATIEAKNIYICGCIKGNMQIEGSVDLISTGSFFGDMLVGNLNIEEGAVFKGNCQMHDPKSGGDSQMATEEGGHE